MATLIERKRKDYCDLLKTPNFLTLCGLVRKMEFHTLCQVRVKTNAKLFSMLYYRNYGENLSVSLEHFVDL